ncbi:MAG: hypothetical protein GY809_23425 [Planctomycetes bacterium]|nr:hypothetical protein [Planctomycetota bacterium]
MFNRQTASVYACLIVLAACMPGSLPAAQPYEVSVEAVRHCIDRGIAFFHSISTQGGYVYYVTADLTRRWGGS